MLDHIVPMFGIDREKVLALMEAQQASIAREREKLEAAKTSDDDRSHAVISSDLENIEQALTLLRDREYRLAVEREHLDAGPWKISAAQLTELYTRYQVIEFPPIERLRLVLDVEKQMRMALHNQQFRQARM